MTASTTDCPEADAPPGASRRLLSGVEAVCEALVVRRALDERAGLDTATFVSGYPGSPLGTLDLAVERLGGRLAANRIVHQPGLNEELAAAAVWGSQMGEAVPYAGVDGVVGAWYGKGPGLDRCGDVLKHADFMGTGPNGGAVLFVGDDPSAKSSTLPYGPSPTRTSTRSRGCTCASTSTRSPPSSASPAATGCATTSTRRRCGGSAVTGRSPCEAVPPGPRSGAWRPCAGCGARPSTCSAGRATGATSASSPTSTARSSPVPSTC